MQMLAQQRPTEPGSGRAFRWYNWLLLVGILSLGASLATRYVYVSSVETVTTVKAGSPDNHHHRQRLCKNALQWPAPVEEFTVLESPVGFRHPAPMELLLVVHFDEPLYNRPPPIC